MRRALVVAVLAAGALATAPPTHADPYGPGPGMCSFQGEYFTQWYPCTQPPAWLFLPHSDDAQPGIGTATSPYN